MEPKLKILLLEDSEDDATLVVRALRKGGLDVEEKRVDTHGEFMDAIRHFVPDVILSDHALPQFNSLEALSVCRRLKISVPFILVTGAVSEEFAVICLKQGADDYVLKTNLSRLPNSVQAALKQRKLQVQRTLAEENLRVQNEALTKVNMELDRFVYSVSHNLRAPLMSVLGLLNLSKLEDAARDNHFREYFKMMDHSIKRLDETLREILEYSRNSRSEVESEQVELREVINESLERLQYLEGSSLIEKNIRLQAYSDFYSDRLRLVMIFSNLISNAIRYRDEEKPICQLNISATITKDVVTIVVEDNGIGIDPSLLPKIFDMFFRATAKSDGAGLGLYIVKEAVNSLGGTIQVESALGYGTRFHIELPNLPDVPGSH